MEVSAHRRIGSAYSPTLSNSLEPCQMRAPTRKPSMLIQLPVGYRSKIQIVSNETADCES
jgi:hypothetical protein